MYIVVGCRWLTPWFGTPWRCCRLKQMRPFAFSRARKRCCRWVSWVNGRLKGPYRGIMYIYIYVYTVLYNIYIYDIYNRLYINIVKTIHVQYTHLVYVYRYIYIYIYINIRCMIFSPWISLVILMIVTGCHRGRQGIEVDGVGAVSVLRPGGTRLTVWRQFSRPEVHPISRKIPGETKGETKNPRSLLKSHSRQNRRQATWWVFGDFG